MMPKSIISFAKDPYPKSQGKGKKVLSIIQGHLLEVSFWMGEETWIENSVKPNKYYCLTDLYFIFSCMRSSPVLLGL